MTTVLQHLDNVEAASVGGGIGGGGGSDTIAQLFAKCRPPTTTRSDVNLNPVVGVLGEVSGASSGAGRGTENDNSRPPAGPISTINATNAIGSIGNMEPAPNSSGSDSDSSPCRRPSRTRRGATGAATAARGAEAVDADTPCCEDRGDDDDDDDSSDVERDDEDDEDDEEEVGVTGAGVASGVGGGGASSSGASSVSGAEAPPGGYSASASRLRDSRIIEIAGGRELFSQSRSKAGRAGRLRHPASGPAASAPATSEAERPERRDKKAHGVWELRNASGSDGRKARSGGRDVTETVFSTEVRSVRRGGGEGGGVLTGTSAAGTGEVVVFDDIGDAEWRGLRLDLNDACSLSIPNPCQPGSSSASPSPVRSPTHSPVPSPAAYHRTVADFFKSVTSASDLDRDSLSPERGRVTRIIGSVPIAEYEGSPRRYGPRPTAPTTSASSAAANAAPANAPVNTSTHPTLPSAHSLLSSPSTYPPRPGFPQRVLPIPPETGAGATSGSASPTPSPGSGSGSAFDYLYEFSETRKVLEEFFKSPSADKSPSALGALTQPDFHELEYELRRQASLGQGSAYVGQRLAKGAVAAAGAGHQRSPRKMPNSVNDIANIQEASLLDLPGEGGSAEELAEELVHDLVHDLVNDLADGDGDTEMGLQVGHSRNFTLSPETTDCDSTCGDLDSEASLLLLEAAEAAAAVAAASRGSGVREAGAALGSAGLGLPASDDPDAPDAARLLASMPVLEDGLSSGHASDTDNNNPTVLLMKRQITEIEREIVQRGTGGGRGRRTGTAAAEGLEGGAMSPDSLAPSATPSTTHATVHNTARSFDPATADPDLEALDPLGGGSTQLTPPPPAPQPHRSLSLEVGTAVGTGSDAVEAAIKDIRLALQRTKTLPHKSSSVDTSVIEPADSPIWVPRRRAPATTSAAGNSATVGPELELRRSHSGEEGPDEEEADTDLETDRLLGQQRTDDQGFFDDKVEKDSSKKKSRNKEVMIHEPAVLIEGVLFRANYLGSTQLVCEGQPTKTTRMNQAEEAVSRIKAPEGETQPSTEVDLFISTEKIMVLNTDLKEIMMDHALRTISYIADIGDLVVLMARRRFVPHDVDEAPKINRTPKMICHVFESEEAQFIAQSIGQAFQVAYMEFLKANGIEDHSFVKEMDYQEVLNSQEIFGDELQMFAKKEMQKEVVVPKAKGEILGVVIVESGWGSMLPTVVIANLAPVGAAARCGQLNIGDQIIAINGVSLVGLPLSTCQNYIKNTKNQTVVKLTVVPCAPVVEVKIKRPDTKYQLGFSVQNGVICSLLRGGIAERGGVRVGHRIIEINNQSVVAVPHEKIVNLLATSVGEILMKTMPTSMFRLLTGQETPVYI